MTQQTYKKEVLLDDERGRGLSAVIKYGPYLFISGSDGHRDLKTERVVPELDAKAVEQCNNAYGRIALRLEKAGYGGDCAIWMRISPAGSPGAWSEWQRGPTTLARSATLRRLASARRPRCLVLT